MLGNVSAEQESKEEHDHSPSSSEDVNAIQAFCTVHLGEHLVDYSVRHACAVMATMI